MQYRIRVKGHLDPSWQHWFDPLQLRNDPSGTTLLSGPLPDQAALYGVLLKLDRLGVALLSLESGDELPDTDQTPDRT